ncbi:L-gulonolactone/D-arabinono-1,4-lactone oxidase [Basidiobolus meristosporus CBS 931.73]|uniref:D-arabinono-1,4-lactone oxidase n=1 Tax=Basidiobolus meristosporus CBS 931.73 TaxID=1314790 RepID=A0A1Y1Y373_9FUNG|nr:L-gulonolactone/D-arabinono-1,4-lactone oxidase [Basidiobolus meristosporus CBS 931.73]|eukprot:ORX92044.1 L-gulonolactone/D-arabinono-1,4-lactone oxidase [Basidiobolus meristosporus CBS 931.73]
MDIAKKGQPKVTYTNWAKTYTCTPELYFQPETEDEIVQIIQLAKANGKTIRVVGAAHSPSDLALTDGYLLNLDKLNKVLKVPPLDLPLSIIQRHQPFHFRLTIRATEFTVQAGIRLFQLHEELDKVGLAMSNLGSISDQSIAGVISTATHGTGVEYGCISTQVTELTLLTADCRRIQCSESHNVDLFHAALCSLGCLGIILELTIQCEPAFTLHSQQEDFNELIRTAEHVRFWWIPHTEDVVVWKANRTEDKPEPAPYPGWFKDQFIRVHLYQYLLNVGRYVPSIIPYINQKYVHWLFAEKQVVKDRSDKVFNFDCLFPQYVNEWAIPWEHTADAIRDLRKFIEEANLKVHFSIEIRFVKEDKVWLSPAYETNVVYIGIIMYRPYGNPVSYKKYWAGYEKIMKSYRGRPHWAKAHPLTPSDLSKIYPKFNEFCQLRANLDPTGLFLNSYTRRHLLGLSDKAKL